MKYFFCRVGCCVFIGIVMNVLIFNIYNYYKNILLYYINFNNKLGFFFCWFYVDFIEIILLIVLIINNRNKLY